MALIAPIANDTGTGGTTTYTTLRYGSTGAAVVSLQKQLASYGFYTGSLDGKFGPATLNAVKAFQQATGNTVDGIAGPATQKTLATYKPPTTTTEPAPIVKPRATTQPAGATTDTGTGTPTVTTPPPVSTVVIKPQEAAQQGYTDTGTSQTAPTVAPVSTQAQPIAVQQPIPIVKPQAEPAPTAGITDTGTGTPYVAPAPAPLPQKPQAAAQQGYTDTGTGGTVSQISPATVAPEGIEKPQEVARRGMTDTGTGTPMPPDIELGGAVGAPPATQWGEAEGQVGAEVRGTPSQTAGDRPSLVGGGSGGGYVGGAGWKPPTGGTGLTPTVGGESGTGTGVGGETGTGIVPTTGGDTGTGTIIDEGFEVEPNPYIEQITSMQFSYDPNTDENYLRMAAALENQITQSMVGRGGLYSSVTGYSIQIGLTNLLMEMYEKAYQSFMDERDFLMEMSRDHEARVQADFNRRMDIAQYQFALQKEAFAQQMDIAKFNFAQQQEAFDQQMAIMEYNFAVEKEKFDQRMAQAAHNLSAQRLKYQKEQDALNYQLKQQEIALANQQLLVEQEYNQMKRDVTFDKTVLAAKLDKAKELNDRWLDDVYATDPEVQAFFGITPRTTWQGGSGVRQRVFEALDAEKDAVATRALELEMYDVFTGAKQDWAESDTSQTITTKVGDTTISTTKKVPSSER